MIDTVVVGIAQWLPTPGAHDENLEAALGFVDELARSGCGLAVLPELWPCGYDPRTLADDVRASAEPLDGPRAQALAAAARAANVWLAAGSIPEIDGDRFFNTALLFSPDGRLVAHHRKAHLYPAAGEPDAIEAGHELTVCETEPFGAVGLAVCFDGDFPEFARALRLRGARVVVQVSAYELGAEPWWDVLYPANALANGQWWLMANQCGTVGSETFFGGSRIVSPLGKVVADAARARAGESPPPELLVAEIRLREELARADQTVAALFGARRPELYAV